MRLPYLENVQVKESKVTGYLLSEELSEGKAAFFAALGFTVERWELLRDALIAHATSYDVAREISSPFGTMYLVEGSLQTLDGRNPGVRSVWIIEAGTDVPLPVTAYPLKRRRGSNGAGERVENA